ncbi:MAG: hypothetical protein OCC45_12680 [Desulfotalea sp.]
MEKSPFFKKLWCFNALIISVAGILAIVLLIFGGYHVIKDIYWNNQIGNVVNVAEDSNIEEIWSFGYMQKLDGTDFIMIPLESDQSYAQSYYSKSSNSHRNLLFINVLTNERKWLFPNNNWLIADNNVLAEIEPAGKSKKVIGLLFNIVKADTNGDKRLTNKDKTTIALSSPSGTKYKEILPEIDLLIGHTIVESDIILILYKKDGVAYSSRYSLQDFRLLNEDKLPKITKGT